MFPKEFSKKLYEKYIKPHSSEKITVTFPDVFHSIPGRKSCIADPFRIVLLKLIENNPTLQILTPKDTGIDVPNEYWVQSGIEFKVYDSKRICFIFVEDKPVLIDYSENSNWSNGPIRQIVKHDPNFCHAAIKFHCDDSSQGKCPIKVFPFLYPGPNDYRDCPEFRESESHEKEYDVFSRVTYSPDYSTQFLQHYHTNTFKHSITAYWGAPAKAYDRRRQYAKLAKQIPNSNIVTHQITKSVSMEKYYEELCQSKFGIAIRGSAKFSHREMELSSIGIPWFSENRAQKMYKPLLPGTHYIEVTPDTFLDVFRYYDDHYEEALEIGLNGREYFHKWHSQTGLQLIFREICEQISIIPNTHSIAK